MTIHGDVGGVTVELLQTPVALQLPLVDWLLTQAGGTLSVEISPEQVVLRGWMGWKPFPQVVALEYPVYLSWRTSQSETWTRVQRWQLTFVSDGLKYRFDGIQCTGEELLELSTHLVRIGLHVEARTGLGELEVPTSLLEVSRARRTN